MLRAATTAIIPLETTITAIAPTLFFFRQRRSAMNTEPAVTPPLTAQSTDGRLVGTPLLIFPTAGGDFEEIERFHLVGSLQPLIDEGRIKVYSVDSINGRTFFTGADAGRIGWMMTAFDSMIRHEVVPASSGGQPVTRSRNHHRWCFDRRLQCIGSALPAPGCVFRRALRVRHIRPHQMA